MTVSGSRNVRLPAHASPAVEPTPYAAIDRPYHASATPRSSSNHTMAAAITMATVAITIVQ